MSMKMYVVWTNDPDAIEAIAQDIYGDDPELTDAERYDQACMDNYDQLDDERANLNIEVGDNIIVIRNLGLWNGHRMGYKLLNSTNIADCLSGTCGDYVTWFVDDRGDLNCRDIHHDGTNMYLYRAWKPDVSDARRETLMRKIAWGIATRKDITRATRRIGNYIADVYGWKVRK